MKKIDINYDISLLKPVISEKDFIRHLDIYNDHVDRFNAGLGDIPFEKAGAYLHSLYFENIRDYRTNNPAFGKVSEILEMRYGTEANFIKTYLDAVNKLQGSGWVFMNTSGYLNIIPNNRIVDNIAFIIDFWEHSYYNQFGSDKEAYAKQSLHMINWDAVNSRILDSKKEK